MKNIGIKQASSLTALATLAVVAPFLIQPASAQVPADPGVRGGAAGAGGTLANPTTEADEFAFFQGSIDAFQETDGVEEGLGPRFNGDSCGGCHAFPAMGGSSPTTNPQVTLATLNGATNTIPTFITKTGPVREARFINNPDGTPDGGVHDLFTITGRADAPGCKLKQPNFPQQLAANNVIFRIPTPTFGLGLVENTTDAQLDADQAAFTTAKNNAGIAGHFNHSGNDGTITRFGWKGQNKSLVIFAGEAYNVEQGVTNELFPNEREDDANCQFNALQEDHTPVVNTHNSGSNASDFSSDVVRFGQFMRLLSPPVPAASTASTQRGQQAFNNVGCNLCHITSHKTHTSSLVAGLNSVTYQPFSDFMVHNMGDGLSDGVSQGNADGPRFRSAPLWGLGQRIFFLHDGRTKDLLQAIEAHESNNSAATTVEENFDALPNATKQDILNFLRSL
jgi:CxxC motif-containing protein (DUF1111 family)